jgi:indolepyruvate ferredoxin oxidoreductase alpha subunit
VAGDDPSCWSSAQSEQNSRAFAYLAHIPILEPSDPAEAKDFTKLAFDVSDRFDLPIMLRTTTRVAHQRMPVEMEQMANGKKQMAVGEFIKDKKRFVTLPPRVLEMKAELLEKIEEVRNFAEESKENKIIGKSKAKIGIITSGVSYLYVMEALKELKLDLPVLKLAFFYPLPEERIKGFIKNLKRVLIVEELEGFLEKEINVLAREVNPELQINGKNLLSEIGELNQTKVALALANITGKKLKIENSLKIENWKLEIPKRFPRFCPGCPHAFVFNAVKKAAPEGTVFGGDIGCYMLAGMPAYNLQDYLFSMGSSIGIGHGIKKMTGQKVIAFIGDSTFFHAGIPALINTVFNKSNPLINISDNITTAMTGHQTNPGLGRTGMGEITPEIKIEDIVVACGVKNLRVIDPINQQELENAIQDFLNKDEVSVIVARRICIIAAKKNAKENE